MCVSYRVRRMCWLLAERRCLPSFKAYSCISHSTVIPTPSSISPLSVSPSVCMCCVSVCVSFCLSHSKKIILAVQETSPLTQRSLPLLSLHEQRWSSSTHHTTPQERWAIQWVLPAVQQSWAYLCCTLVVMSPFEHVNFSLLTRTCT